MTDREKITALALQYVCASDPQDSCYALKDLRDFEFSELMTALGSLAFDLDVARADAGRMETLLREGLSDEDGNTVPLTVNSVDDERGGSALYLEIPDGYSLQEASEQPWPEWAEKLLRLLESWGNEYEHDDEINLPDELAEWLHHYASDLKRTAAARFLQKDREGADRS